MQTTNSTRRKTAGAHLWVVPLGLLLAIGLGIYSDVGQRLHGPLGLLPELGTPWLLLAFTAARMLPLRQRALAAPFGMFLVVVGLASYYVFMHLWHGVNYYNLVNSGRGVRWFLLAIVLGLTSACAGRVTRGTGETIRSIGWGYAMAVPLAEIYYLSLAEFPGASSLFLAIVLLLASVGLTIWALRSHVAVLRLVITTTTWLALGLASIGVGSAMNLL